MGWADPKKILRISLAAFSCLVTTLLLNCGAGTSPVGAPLGGDVSSLGGSPTAPTQGATQSDQKTSDTANDPNDAQASARILSRDVGGGDGGSTANSGAPLSAGLPVPTNGFLGDDEGTPGYRFKLIHETITPLIGKGQGMVKNDTTGQVMREKDGGALQGCCENQWMLFEVRDKVNDELHITCAYAQVREDGNFAVSFTGAANVFIWPIAYLFNAGETPNPTSQGPCPGVSSAMLPGVTVASGFFREPPTTTFIHVLPDPASIKTSLPIKLDTTN